MLTLNEYHRLVSVMNKHAEEYYVHDNPTISDFDWDMIYKQLEEFEEQYPMLKVPDSPTNKVGGEITKSNLPKVTRAVPMLSLDNTYSPDELEKWLRKFGAQMRFIIMPKYDGLAGEVSYVNGKLTMLSTRGDGTVGEDVTISAEHIKDLPSELNDSSTVSVRGEIFITDEDFLTIADDYVDPRNAAAGILRRLKPGPETKLLTFRAYGLLYPNENNPAICTHKIKDLENLGFALSSTMVRTDKIIPTLYELRTAQASSGIPIDGAVITVALDTIQEHHGFTNKYPKFAIAYKYETIKYHTPLIGVRLQTGRTGKVTPVGILEPVKVGNVMVEKASFCNGPYMERLGVMIGDEVIIHRAGEVIPQVVGLFAVGESERTPIPKITHCPSCDSKVSTRFNLDGSETVDVFCNNKECPAVLLRGLESHVSRKCTNIIGMGPSVIKKLVTAGHVKNIADIYNLTIEQLTSIGLGGKVTSNLWLAIAKAMETTPAANVICSLGISDIGNSVSKDLVRGYTGVWDKEVLIKRIEECGTDAMVANVKNHEGPIDEVLNMFHSTSTQTEITKEPNDNLFKGKRVGITGSFGELKRDEIVGWIEESGGTYGSVGKKTDLVIVGDDAGKAKIAAIEKHGIKIIDISEVKKEVVKANTPP